MEQRLGNHTRGIKRINRRDGKLPKVFNDFDFVWFVMDPAPKKGGPERAGIQVVDPPQVGFGPAGNVIWEGLAELPAEP